MQPRIHNDDHILIKISRLSENDVRAVAILRLLMRNAPVINQGDPFGVYSGLIGLDAIQIYGKDICKLHDELCSGDIVKTIAVICAAQLGIIHPSAIHAAIKSGKFDGDDILNQVRMQVPSFGWTPVQEPNTVR